jgi:hypothetical protein
MRNIMGKRIYKKVSGDYIRIGSPRRRSMALYIILFFNKFAVISLINKMKVIRYKPQPPKVPTRTQEALMKYCSKKPAA